jgi:hypothetical protein
MAVILAPDGGWANKLAENKIRNRDVIFIKLNILKLI